MKPSLERVGRVPLAGVVVTLVALLAMWRDNMNRLPFESVWPTVTVALALAAMVVVVLRPITGNWARAGLVGGLIAAYMFYVPVAVDLLPLPRWAAIIIHLILLAALVMVALRIPKDAVRAAELAGKINLVAAILFLITAVPVLASQLAAEPVRAKASSSFAALDGRAAADSPDVWHLLFDRYAGLETFRTAYGYDNRPFVEALRKRGFAVQGQAYSNYQRTGHSVASTLNGTLLDPLAATMADRPDDWVPIYRSMRDSAALNVFNRMGYKTIFAGSWWEPTRFSASASQSLRIRAMPQLARLAIDRSAFGFWAKDFSLPWLDGRVDQCFRANEKFRRLTQISGSPGRKQVFAHFLVPHPPFVLNANGSCRSLDQARKSSRRDNYIAQVEFANRQALALIDAISAGPRPAVIVIHSDEGPWPLPYVGNEHGLGTDPVQVPWAELPTDKLRDKMAILLAMRGPSGPPRTMPASPVQIYPAILRDHFGSSAELPPSRHAIFESDNALYRFTDVSEKLKR
ncbi:MAG: hypothetical protein LH465_01970 [Sphingomonas bacterium]|nr:hypothetical protein [Sphingomonas bacterium]